MDDDKTREVLTALLDEMRQSKIQLSDVLAQRSEYAADIKDLKAAIDTTRRALDPEQLGQHVADNIDQFMGETSKLAVKSTTATLAAAQTSQHVLEQTKQTANLAISAQEALTGIATRLEERDKRSKWDWVTLATAMIISAGLAGAGAVYFTKQNLDTANFTDAISLIQNDADAYWCGSARASIIQDKNGVSYCAIQMPKYQPTDGEAQTE